MSWMCSYIWLKFLLYKLVNIPVTWEHMGIVAPFQVLWSHCRTNSGTRCDGDSWNMVENFGWLGWFSLNYWCNLEWRKAPLRGSSVAPWIMVQLVKNYQMIWQDITIDRPLRCDQDASCLPSWLLPLDMKWMDGGHTTWLAWRGIALALKRLVGWLPPGFELLRV